MNVTMFATYITGDLLPEALEVFKAGIVGSSNLSTCSYSERILASHLNSWLLKLINSHRRLASKRRLRTGEGKMLARSSLAR